MNGRAIPGAYLFRLYVCDKEMYLFVFSCTLYFIRTCFFVLIVLHLAYSSLLTTQNTNIHAPGGIRTRNPSRRAAADPRLRPLGHWDRLRYVILVLISIDLGWRSG